MILLNLLTVLDVNYQLGNTEYKYLLLEEINNTCYRDNVTVPPNCAYVVDYQFTKLGGLQHSSVAKS